MVMVMEKQAVFIFMLGGILLEMPDESRTDLVCAKK